MQLASEFLSGRSLPGFSSDQIRFDQSRSSKRFANSAPRQAKLKLINDYKLSQRREAQEAIKAAENAAFAAQAQVALHGPTGTVNGVNGVNEMIVVKEEPTTGAPTAVPTTVGTAQTSAVTTPATALVALPGTETPTGPAPVVTAAPVVVAL